MKKVILLLAFITSINCIQIISQNNFVDFDGENDYIQLPNGIVETAADFTFEAWVLWDGGASWQRVFDFGSNADVNMFLTPKSGFNSLRFAITPSGISGEEQLNSTPLPTGLWQHVAIVLDQMAPGNVNGYMYVNGVEVATNLGMSLDPTILGNSTQNFLGKSQYPDAAFDGLMDEVRIWNVARTPTEIAATWNTELTGTEPGLLAYYNFNQGVCGGDNSGNPTVADQAGSNDGTMITFDLNGCASNFVCASTCAIPDPFCGPTYTFTGASPTNSNDPTDADNWMDGCVPPANNAANIITIEANQTLIGTPGFTLWGSVTNNGTIAGPITIDGDVTNNGTIAP